VIGISAATGEGLGDLQKSMVQVLDETPEQEKTSVAIVPEFTFKDLSNKRPHVRGVKE
jgi:hypothetical protein